MLKIFGNLFVILCAISLVVCELEVDVCEDGAPLPTYIEVVGCEAQPCQLITGTDMIMYMNFTASEPIKELRAEVVAKAFGVNINFPLPRPNACEELTNTHCPLAINERAQYKLIMPIESWYPPITLRLTFYLLHNGNTAKNKFMCFSIQATVSG